MKSRKVRRCLKCDRPIPASRWLCPACRLENREVAPGAEGVVDFDRYEVDDGGQSR